MLVEVTVEIEYGVENEFLDEFKLTSDVDDPIDAQIDEVEVKRHGSDKWERVHQSHLIKRYAQYENYHDDPPEFKGRKLTALQKADEALRYKLTEQAVEQSEADKEQSEIDAHDDREYDKYDYLDRDFDEHYHYPELLGGRSWR